MAETIVSAPGKVLLAGGYLVLDRKYTGLVVATSSRFYCSVRNVPSSEPTTDRKRITVRAGQFPASSSTWEYDFLHGQLDAVGGGKNKFVAITLAQVLQYARESLGDKAFNERMGEGLKIVVLADNDFYSQREQVGLPMEPELTPSWQQHPCQHDTPPCPLLLHSSPSPAG